MNVHSRLKARLKGTCFITVAADGTVTGTQAALTVQAGQEPTAQGLSQEVSSKDAPRDPGAPPETEAEAVARVAKEREAETPEQTTAREAAEAAQAEETARRAALTDEQRTAEDTAKAAEESTAKDKAWAERDVTKDVPVSPEQKAQIAKLAKTPEQISAMEAFTLETNTTNDLSPASRAKAAALWNVTPDMVDQYVASVISTNKGVAEAVTYDNASEDMAKWSPEMKGAFKERMDALYEVAGSEANWNEFSTWADANLKPEAMSALQAAISASPVVGATVAKSMMQAWKAQGNGGGPVDLSRGAGMAPAQPQSKVQPFATKADQNTAINDPRYAKDPGYRQSVDARMVVSNFASAVEKSFYDGVGPMM